tara:strand:- start:299 stop:1390 length:1092 start_codon:yes stop_codon:yes gene_type:complete
MPTRALTTRHAQDLELFADRWAKAGLVLLVLLCLGFPLMAGNKWLVVGLQAQIAIVGSVSLMILTGFAGQISMGHAAFIGIGAYTTAMLGEHHHFPFWLALPLAGLAAAAVGMMIGPFALRLRGLYLALITVGLVFIVKHMLYHQVAWTGGAKGMKVPAYLWFGGDAPKLSDYAKEPLDLGVVSLDSQQLMFFVFLLLAVAVVLCGVHIARSNTGRAMMAVRDHDLAASVLGIHPARTKVLAFGISSFFAGVCGGMLALQLSYLMPDGFGLPMSVNYIAMIVLGGIGTIFGGVWGAIMFVVLHPVAEQLQPYVPYFSERTDTLFSTVLFAVVVCIFLIFEPLGLFGFWLRIKRYFLAWPFRYG